MIVTLSKSKDIVVVKQETKTITTLTIDRIVDNPKQKFVRCFISELNEPVTLWEGDEYDAIGQWVDTDVEKKLKELFK